MINYGCPLYFPQYPSRRLVAQGGCFLIDTLSFYSYKQNYRTIDERYFAVMTALDEPILEAIIIPANCRQMIKNNLINLGIDAFTLFPDLEGLAMKTNYELAEGFVKIPGIK